MRRALLVSGALLALVAAGCKHSAAGGGGPVVVFAAASLTGPFTAMAREFERNHPGGVQLVFEGTPDLVRKLRDGAQADVLASADEANMQKAVGAKGTAAPPRPFAHNVLTIVTGKGNPKGIRALADLARPDLKVLLCGPEVPAGSYARQALQKASVTVQPVSDEPDVKAVVSKVQLGEADAGIVYVTDAKAAGDKVSAVAIPDQHNVVAVYPIAVLSSASDRQAGEAFVQFVLAADGQRILQAAGFRGP
jgi:molybdate transport system substrate-binding protein